MYDFNREDCWAAGEGSIRTKGTNVVQEVGRVATYLVLRGYVVDACNRKMSGSQYGAFVKHI